MSCVARKPAFWVSDQVQHKPGAWLQKMATGFKFWILESRGHVLSVEGMHYLFSVVKLELMFMKHYAPNRCLYIKVAKLRTGVGSAGCHTYKIAVSKYQGRCEQRSELFLGGGGVKVHVNEELKFLGSGVGVRFRHIINSLYSISC